MNILPVDPLGLCARIADTVMIFIMCLAAGTFAESPQQTHWWNNQKLQLHQVAHLSAKDMVHHEGIPGATPRYKFYIPLFHVPILGGWRDYVVLEPVDPNHDWYVGWIWNSGAGVSRIQLRGPVRMLVGPGDVSFFGIKVGENDQIKIRQIGTGRIGDRGKYSKVPLL